MLALDSSHSLRSRNSLQSPQAVARRRRRGLLTWVRWHWRSCVSGAVKDSLAVETPRPDHSRRAVDVNRPVPAWLPPCCGFGERLRDVTEGLTSPARLETLFGQAVCGDWCRFKLFSG
ncbi:MAG UNVERIFIED_CONTAM: hypothetical protein LVR18_26805 [Planctomycetaceae bacterium]